MKLILLARSAQTVALALELLFLIFVTLLRVVFGSNASVELQLKDVVIVVGHAANVFAHDVCGWIELARVFNLLPIDSRSLPFECVETAVFDDKLGWIDFHLLLHSRLSFGLLVADRCIEFNLKRIRMIRNIS